MQQGLAKGYIRPHRCEGEMIKSWIENTRNEKVLIPDGELCLQNASELKGDRPMSNRTITADDSASVRQMVS